MFKTGSYEVKKVTDTEKKKVEQEKKNEEKRKEQERKKEEEKKKMDLKKKQEIKSLNKKESPEYYRKSHPKSTTTKNWVENKTYKKKREKINTKN